MNEIKVNLGIDDDAIASLIEAMEDQIIEKVKDDLETSLSESIRENLEIDDDISNWMDYHFDIDDYLRDKDLTEYIDIPSVDVDIEDKAQGLLESYSPLNGCRTGELFTQAVNKAVRYLLLKDNDFVQHIVDAAEKNAQNKIIADTKDSLIKEIKPAMYDEFRKELNQYVLDLEIAKAQELISQSTTNVIPELPNNNLGY